MTKVYDRETFICRHEADEGILNTKLQKKYPTTLTAFLEAESFDDLEVYTDLTLSSTSKKPIEQIYMERFADLRKKHDYLELWWGGGYDSTYILYVSMLTEMPVDAVTMYCKGDPRKDPTGINFELSSNWKHLDHYRETFGTAFKINLLDIDHMWDITKTKHHDYDRWCYSTYGMFDDISRMSSDDVLSERNTKQGTIITGKGYGGVVYNKQYDTWSYYTEALNVNYPGATSYKLPITRFYRTPDIIKNTAEKSREWFYKHRPDFKNTWATTEHWDHHHTRFPELQGQIKHLGKGDWQTSPKFKYWVDDKTDRKRYPEYWDFVDWLERKISPEMFIDDSGFMGKGLKEIRPHMIDF